jgi:serine/threonine protein kinase/tetratricopeptide (TPR) repeat protein
MYADNIFANVLACRVAYRAESTLDGRVGLPANTKLAESYRIVRQIGAGGFGITYAAEDINLVTMVAIKEYYPEEFGDRNPNMSVRAKSERHKPTFDWGRSSFIQEARTLARFQHASVVRVSRVFEANSTAYMVMDFEQGQSFEAWLKGLGRLPTQEELDRIVGPLLDALETMHAENFLHRDIAPDNIIIRPNGTPVLLDFGASRRAVAEKSRTLTGIVKAGYSPQEQYASDSRLQGPWSDLYALGATLYRAVAGTPPEEATIRVADDRMVPAAGLLDGRYRPAFLSGIDACLEVRHTDRPQSVAQLRPILLGQGSQPSVPFPKTRKIDAPKSSRTVWPAVVVVLLLVGASYGVLDYVLRQADADAKRGEEAKQQAIATEAKKNLDEAASVKTQAEARRLQEERIAAERRAAEQRARQEQEARREADAAAARSKAEAAALEQTFLDHIKEGAWSQAEPLAVELLKQQPGQRTAHAFLGVVGFKAQRYAEADAHCKMAGANPIGELASTLARAWLYQAEGLTQDAFLVLDAPKQPEWAQYYLRFHKALLADQAGRRAEARAAYERIPKNDQRTLRVALAYARHAANAGDVKLALSVLKAQAENMKSDAHPIAQALQEQIETGYRPELLIKTLVEGMAEVFYGLGEALTGEAGVGVGTVYLQFALYLTPDSEFALAALANANETAKRYEAAIATYDRIPKGTPLQLSIDIRKALNLTQLGKVDEAQKLLDELARQNPRDIRPLDALGNIMRGSKRFAEAADYYSRAIALIGKPEQKHWTYFYSRGTSYERLKKWPEAEADLQRALQLSPDQAIVLNYLGYSWIDRNRNLKQGLAMIEKAVRLMPDDGYIVDSLGWAHYRMGNFKEAAKYLERAIQLRPEDPVLNDHLGDAYWRLGRRTEARSQWEKALTLNPEPDDAEKLRSKIASGLTEN